MRDSAEDFLSAYIECALWSSTDDDGRPLDKKFSRDSLSGEALLKMIKDCRAFREQAGIVILRNMPRAGHDFWLSRNGHGAGFFDGAWGEYGDKLQALAKSFGECNLMINGEELDCL